MASSIPSPHSEETDTRTRHEKYEDLLEILRGLGKTAVAFSGGVDSTFLLAAAKEAPVAGLVAMTMKRPYIAQWELDEADEFIRKLGIDHEIVELPVDEEVRNNVANRCYYCKSSTFGYFREQLEKMGFDTLVDGTNADDTQEYRPGLRAIRENGVRSPLQEAGLTKDEIRSLSREMGLAGWDKPANTCLVTRIPYNTLIRDEDLRLIEQAEYYMMKQGFRQVRVRKHNDLARIEVEPGMVARLLEPETAARVTDRLKELGFRYVSLDLEGYKTGKMDQTILKNSK
ncbi:MAG: ATP-dependent sacrificial sulfur transferase LarE [Cyclonatronaceae bacterium]